MSTDPTNDPYPSPGIPPLAVAGILALLMWLLARVLPHFALQWPSRTTWSLALAVTGLAMVLAGVVPFRRADTTVDPRQPGKSSALVTRGIYARTRNPMYVGMLLVLLGWGAFLSNGLGLALGPAAFFLYVNHRQIPAEERALSQAFGDAYREYARRVRRWL
jgi:protein-S-isoprenylcysteine O-methyltransferase Ste14